MTTANPTRETELGIEKFCTSCQNWWPADREFFHRQPSGHLGLRSQCRACALVSDNTRRGVGLPPPPAPIPDIFSALLLGAGSVTSRPRAGATERGIS